MTKVLDRLLPVLIGAWCLLATVAWGQSSTAAADCPQTTAALYSRLSSIGLDEHRVYRVRGAAIDHANLHIVFDSGTIAFSEDVCGRTTGAYFEGQGEVLLRPPNNVERASLALFTGMAILEEQFGSAYLRFNDDTAEALRPFLSSTEEGSEFVQQRNDTARRLAELDAFRLLLDFSYLLPTADATKAAPPRLERMVHARFQGNKLGLFEVFWDEAAREQIWAGQVRTKDGTSFWDIWTSFSAVVPGRNTPRSDAPEPEVTITNFRIRSTVQPPTELRANTEVDLEVRKGGRRALAFELSRYLKADPRPPQCRP